MFNNKKANVLWLSLIKLGLLIVMSVPALATEKSSNIVVSPSQCVALTQGQKCYVDATVSWVLPNEGNYCLYSSQKDKPIICWQKKSSGSFKQEFASDKNIVFKLKSEKQKTIATGQLKVTWVHQKKGQPRMWWRVF